MFYCFIFAKNRILLSSIIKRYIKSENKNRDKKLYKGEMKLK